LHRASQLQRRAPLRAAALLEEAGPGAALESFRFRLWARVLARGSSPPGPWRRLLEAGPPVEVRRAALVGLGRALLRDGKEAEAVTALEEAAAEGSRAANGELLGVASPAVRERTARRLAVKDPRRLRRLAPEMERRMLRALTPGERLQRAASWRRGGFPGRGARDLLHRRWRGGLERARRLELARCELAANRPARAIRLLAKVGRSGISDLLLRARGERRLGWDLFPRPAGRRHFRLAFQAAARVAVYRSTPASERIEAFEITLETATELGDLERAWMAWRMLGRLGWSSPMRTWLGRRLGVALARRGDDGVRVEELERELPGQARCLTYWRSVGRPGGAAALERLAAAPIEDLYARWSRGAGGVPRPPRFQAAPAVGMGDPPLTVRTLLDWGETHAARREWRRLRDLRGATPREAMAAAALEASGPHPTQSVRWLRAAFPNLGTVLMARAPEDAIQAYLPLRWTGEIRKAARESGLDPWLVAGLARQESTFVADARSPRGAVGLLQLTPGTAGRRAAALGLGKRPDLEAPEVNLRIGAHELAHLIDRFGALEPALAAYNGGEARVARWWKRWPNPQRFTEEIPVPESYTYVRRVVFLADAYRQVYASQWRSP